MSARLNKKNILTIPNALSLFRLILIPLIVWLYVGKQEYGWSIGVIALSGFTDILDGWIARKTGQVTDVGKVLDPIADKMTQGILLICLALRYPWLWVLIGLFVLKELLMAVMGIITIRRKNQVNSAKWYGKLCTAALYCSIGLLILFPDLPVAAPQVISGISAGALLFSLVMYCGFYSEVLQKPNKMKTEET